MISDPRLFRYLVEASTDGIWLLDGDGQTLWANARMAELLGRSPEEMSGLSAYDVHDDAGKAQFATHLEEARGGDPGHGDLETMYVRPDGTPIWLLASYRPVHDDAGQFVGYLHRYTDHTQQRTLLETLRERERTLAEAQAIANIGSWEWDAATERSKWSDQLFRIYGVTEEEFAASKEGYLDFVHPEDKEVVRAEVNRIHDGIDEQEWQARIIRRSDGEIRWLRGLGRAERAPDGTLIRVVGTDQDITDRVLADQEIAEATRRLALLRQVAEVANQSTGLVETLLRSAATVGATPGWDPLCAFLPEDDGSELVPLMLSHGESSTGALPDAALAAQCLRTGEMVMRPVLRHEETHTLVAIPIRHGEGVACVVEVVSDEVPPDPKSRDLIEQITSMLGRVAERERAAAELAEARDQAMAASRMKSQFLATMSHEIRTPMNGVIGLTDLLLRTELDASQRKLADALHGAGLTLRALINDILDLSKIEAGKLELELVDFSVRSMLDQTVALLAGPADEKALELVVDVDPDVPAYLRGDATRLGQVIANLGSNAVKFTDEGQVRIRVGVVDPLDREWDRGTQLEVAVSDTGPGIPPEAQQRLFDAFTQADPSTTRRHGGTGLGLTIARQLVHALGGQLSLESEPGQGSTFRFTAHFDPATGDRRDHAAPIGRSRPTQVARPKVLVVEDNDVNQMVAVGMLENAGYDADVAIDGVEAVAALAGDHGYVAVLMDCRMPRMDGFDATRAIREQEPSGRRVPIIAMTASALEGERERCLDAGMDDFLTKPVDSSRVERTLQQWLAGTTDGGVTAAEEEAPEEAAGRNGIVDLERVEMLHEMVKDGVSLFQRSSGNFVAHAEDHLAAIRSALSDGDGAELMAAAHKLKGSALNLGLPLVGAAALDLEERGRDGRLEGAESAYDALAQEMDRALEALLEARATRA